MSVEEIKIDHTLQIQVKDKNNKKIAILSIFRVGAEEYEIRLITPKKGANTAIFQTHFNTKE